MESQKDPEAPEAPEAPDAPQPSFRGFAVAAGLVVALAGISWWAFSEDTTPTSTEAGVRVDSTSAYNPVTAGESLPDGFRQLLPRDAILPVYDPRFVPATAAGWADATDVIGVEADGEAKAYPVSFLNGREMVIDEIAGDPVLVTW